MLQRLLLLLLLATNARGVTMTNLVQDAFGNPYPVRVIITPFTPSIVFGGTNVLGPSVAFNNNKQTGAWSVNLLGGFYLVQQGLSQPIIPIFSMPGDGQTNSFAFFASAATNPIPTFCPNGGTCTGTGLNTSNLFPSTIIFNSSSNVVQSIPNAFGSLTNNGGGIIGWYPAYLSNTNDNGTNMNFYQTTSFFGSTNGNTYWLDWTRTNVTAAYNGTNFYGSGLGLTNLIYRYTTNPIPALSMTFSKAYFTNLSASITISSLLAQDLTAFETGVLFATNSSGSDWSVTMPSGVWGTPGSGTPPVLWCTNKQLTVIYFEHYGALMTNTWKKDLAP